MIKSTLINSLLGLNLLAFAAAQTASHCDPLKSGNCPSDPALGGAANIQFSNGKSDKFEAIHKEDMIKYEDGNANFVIEKSGDNPTLQSKFYIMFGRVETVLKAAPGTGIVSSFVLQSDDLDEIDLEWLGGDTTQIQTNYFSKGDTTTYDRGQFHPVNSPQTTFHNYTVDWTKDRTIWYLDNNVIRTLESNAPSGYPQTPMMIRVGSWAGGDTSNNQPGTVEWAGGATNFADGPFTLSVSSINVQDYSTGSEYKYSDRSGAWTSIQAVDGQVNSNENAHEDAQVQSQSESSSTSVESSTQPATSTSSAPQTTSVAETSSTPTSSSSASQPTSSSSSSSSVADATTSSEAQTSTSSKAEQTSSASPPSSSSSSSSSSNTPTSTQAAESTPSATSSPDATSQASSISYTTVAGSATSSSGDPAQVDAASGLSLSLGTVLAGFIISLL